MTRFIATLSFILLSAVGFISCNEKDAPLPKSAFIQDRKIIELGEKVTFTNQSKNAVRYEWDFGNGEKSTSPNPSLRYFNLGTYTVTLTTYNKENLPSVTSSKVKVGERYLTMVSLNKVNFKNSVGNSWDTNDGPDIFFKYKKSGIQSWINSIYYGSNITKEMLPLKVIPAGSIKLENTSWDFLVEDDDNPNTNETMTYWQDNPTTTGEKNYETGIGTFYYRGSDFEIEFNFNVM